MTESTKSVPTHPVAPRLKNGPRTPHIGPDIDAYRAAHALTTAEDSDEWWAKVRTTVHLSTSGINVLSSQVARETLHWDRPFQTVRAGGFETGDTLWFPEGGLNASYNCVDRWALKYPNRVRHRAWFCQLP